MYERRNSKPIPEPVVAQWHPTKNEGITPDMFSSGSERRAWWLCENNHEWEASISQRSRGRGCPQCKGREVNPISVTHPDAVSYWHPSKNEGLSPDSLTKGSHKEVWWKCPSGHEWKRSVFLQLTAKNPCRQCYYQSGKRYASSLKRGSKPIPDDLISQWHPTLNGSLTPQDVSGGSKRKVWWRGECGHEWQAAINNRVNGSGCPKCRQMRGAGGKTLRQSDSEVCAEWNYVRNGELTPDTCSARSNKKVWWVCSACKHEWKTDVASRVLGSGCPFCAGKTGTPLSEYAPDLARQWHPLKNGEVTASDVTFGEGFIAWWICPYGHEWQSRVALRVSRRTGCPVCWLGRSKMEQDLLACVKSMTSEKVMNNVRGGFLGRYELDIYIPELKLGIEFNGEYWHDEVERPRAKQTHMRKEDACRNEDIRLVVVWEREWTTEQDKVLLALEDIIAGGKIPEFLTYNARRQVALSDSALLLSYD